MSPKSALLAGVAFLVMASAAPSAMGAQLDTFIIPTDPESEFKMIYQRTAKIDYQNGGSLASGLAGKTWSISTSADYSDPSVRTLANTLNRGIIADGSSTQVSDLRVEYTADFTGRDSYATIDYRVLLTGTVSGYTIGETTSNQQKILVDLGWRGLGATGPVNVAGTEINMPISAIRQQDPGLYSQIRGTEAEALLSEDLLDGRRIIETPMTNWHFLFDPTGINVDAGTFGLHESIVGSVVSAYTMGESSIREGRLTEIIKEAEFTSSGTKYHVETTESPSTATVRVIGFGSIDRLDDLEIVGVTPASPEGYGTTSTGGFPVAIIYGMAAMAVIGGAVFFVFSSRQLKKENDQGQTGIDPSRLTGYQTSESAGGYHTNRGEAQLKEDTGHAQHKNVYEQADSGQQQAPPPLAAGQDAACGCAASADMGSECDCAMQGSCLCDATCGCSAQICMETAESMR